MKLEFNLNDITRDDLIAAMADKLLTSYVREEETNSTYPTHSPLAKQMKALIDAKISEVATSYTRNAIDEKIKVRISEAVDAVLAEGWQRTDEYGTARGPKVGLKERISELMLKAGSSYDRDNAIDKQIKASVSSVLTNEFQKEIDAAKAKVRAELDSVLSGKVTEALKSAMGLR